MPSILEIASDFITVELSSAGAEMQSIKTRDGREWLWNGAPAFWTGRAPILFPMVGRAPDDVLTISSHSASLAQHGFARRSDFSLASAQASHCRFELAASPSTREVYPFDFLLAVDYSVEGRKLTVTAEVTNRDTQDMPFGFGFHPAFLWPLPGGEGKQHRVILDNKGEPSMQRVEAGLIARRDLPSPFRQGEVVLDHAMFEEDAMIFPEGVGPGLRYGAEGGPELHFHFENLPNVALWSKPGAPFLCIEPWHGTAAERGGSKDLRDRPYTVTLAPGKQARFGFSVELPG